MWGGLAACRSCGLRLAPAAAAGTLNPQRLARLNLKSRFRRKRFRSAAAQQRVSPGRSALPAGEPIRTLRTAIREDRDLRTRQEAELANDTIAATMLPWPTGARAHAIALDAQRVQMLERFHRRVPTVGHVGMGRAIAIAM